MRSKPPIRKRPFLLLEVMVSLLLVLLILTPLLTPLSHMRRAERVRAEQVEMERMARSFFATLKEGLYTNTTHSWEELKGGTTGYFGVKKIGKKECMATYRLEKVDFHNKLSAQAEFLLLDCTIDLACGKNQRRFLFPLLLERRQVR